MIKSPGNVAEMTQFVQASVDNLFNDLIKPPSFAFNDNNNKCDKWSEIDQILVLLYTKIKTCKAVSESDYKTLEDKCVLLEAKVQDLSKPCPECVKSQQNIDNFAKKNESSNKVLFESDADSRSSPPKEVLLEVNLDMIRSLTPAKSSPKKEKRDTSPVRTPPTKRPECETSPIVQKPQRSGKRTKLSISSKNRYRFNKDEGKVNPEQFSELPDLLVGASDEQEPAARLDAAETESKASPISCITVSDETVLSDSSIIEPSPAPVIKHRRTKKSNPFLEGKFNPYECVTDDTTLTPVSVNVLNNNSNQSPLFEKKITPDDSSKPKWDLKPKRELSNKNGKLRQTTLGTAFAKKSKDISTSNEYKGGVVSDVTISNVTVDMELTGANNAHLNSFHNKENSLVHQPDSDDALQETIFYNDTTKKKKPLTDPSAKVKEIFFGAGKSNDRNKKFKSCDISQETIFEEEHSKEKKLPVTAGPNTALQETFYQPSGPVNDLKVSTAQQETYFSMHPDQPNNGLKNGFKQPNNGQIKTHTQVDTASQETFFIPPVTSTVNQVEPEKKNNTKSSKPVPPPSPMNSFDYPPSPDTPKYKYRRDAVRKKAERQKLPGRECPTCLKFYLEDKDKLGDTQMTLIRKCSRHRDKYPIYYDSPKGIWNPRFDDTDDSD